MNARHWMLPLVAAACVALPLWGHEKGSGDDGGDGCNGKKYDGEVRDHRPPDDGKDRPARPINSVQEGLLRIIERFDSNRDGKLSDEEKSKVLAYMKRRCGDGDSDGPQDRKGDGDGEGRPGREGEGGDCNREHPDRPDKEGPHGPPRFKPEGPDGFNGPADRFRPGMPDRPKSPPPRDKRCCDHEDGDSGPKGRMGGGGDDGGDGSGSNGNDSGPRGRKGGPKGNNGVGNGEDPQPPGNPPVNDGPGSGPGNPGNRGHGRK